MISLRLKFPLLQGFYKGKLLQGLKENFLGNNGADEEAHDSDAKAGLNKMYLKTCRKPTNNSGMEYGNKRI